jgi:transcriptional regulator with XRE-family HTH domain
MLRMRARRLELKLSQQAVGYRAGVSNAAVSKIENGWQIPYPSQAERLAGVLGLRPDELLAPVEGMEAHRA